MNGEPRQDQRRSELPESGLGSGKRELASSVGQVDQPVAHSREAAEVGEGAHAAATQGADRELEQASDITQSQENTSQEQGAVSTGKQTGQSIPLVLPQGGNPAEHLTPQQLLETDFSQRRTREIAIQSPGAVPVKEPVRYDTVLFAPRDSRTPPGAPTLDDKAEPVGQSPFQSLDPESSDARSSSELETPALPSSEANSSAESASASEGADPAVPSSEPSGEQHLPRRGDWPPRATPQFQSIVQLSGPNPSPNAASASNSGSAATSPPQSPGSTTTQPPPAEEKAAPLPRVIVMVSLDDAERIVHEEMRAFSRELAIVGRQIAQEETENLMFDFRAQINALLR